MQAVVVLECVAAGGERAERVRGESSRVDRGEKRRGKIVLFEISQKVEDKR